MKFTIYLQRKGGNSKNDDKIRIERVRGNIIVEHYDAHADLTTSLCLTNYSLSQYIRNLIGMVSADNDPFEYIQFNFPGFPSVLYTPDTLQDYETVCSIVNAANMTAESWFTDTCDSLDSSSTSTYSSE